MESSVGPTVSVAFSHGAIELEVDNLAVVPAGDVTLVVEGDLLSDEIQFDGRPRPFQRVGTSLYLSMDLGRSTGIHHLRLPTSRHFWFATEDEKLRLDGVQSLVEHLGRRALAWSGQLLFSDGSYLRDPRVVYGWLDQHADDILTIAESVRANPRQRSVSRARLLDRGGKTPRVPETLALLRKRGREALEEHPDGVIVIGGRAFHPRQMVVRHHARSFDTQSHRTLAWLLGQVLALVREVRSESPESSATRCDEWIWRCASLLERSFLATVRSETITAGSRPRTTEETVDPRYAILFDHAIEVARRFGWAATLRRANVHSYIKYADEIFQQFTAHVIGTSLGGEGLDERAQPLSAGAWDVYRNVQPPGYLMRSWRSYSSDPDMLRPDLTLHRRGTDSVVVLDAKYRRNGHRASESSRRDLMAYMQAFGIDRAVICFPPDPSDRLETHRVMGPGGVELVELAISPVEGLEPFLRRELPDLLARMSVAPRWRDAVIRPTESAPPLDRTS